MFLYKLLYTRWITSLYRGWGQPRRMPVSKAAVLTTLSQGSPETAGKRKYYITIHKSTKLWNNFMVGVTTTWGTVLKGCSIRKVKNHCSKEIHLHWLFVGKKYILNHKVPLAQICEIFFNNMVKNHPIVKYYSNYSSKIWEKSFTDCHWSHAIWVWKCT